MHRLAWTAVGAHQGVVADALGDLRRLRRSGAARPPGRISLVESRNQSVHTPLAAVLGDEDLEAGFGLGGRERSQAISDIAGVAISDDDNHNRGHTREAPFSEKLRPCFRCPALRQLC